MFTLFLFRFGHLLPVKLTAKQWVSLLIPLFCVYLLGLVILPLVEPPGTAVYNHFQSLSNYTWWFFVTAFTVGYGDMYPVTFIGRACAILIMFEGISTLSATLIALGQWAQERIMRKMKGQGNYARYSGHIVFIGYTATTEAQVLELFQSQALGEKVKIVLVDHKLEENPLANLGVDYVKGPLDHGDAFLRAGVKTASRVIIQVGDDAVAGSVTAEICDLCEAGRVIVELVHESSLARVMKIAKQFGDRVTCITPLTAALISQEIANPGFIKIIVELASTKVGDAFFSLVYKGAPAQYGDLLVGLYRNCGALLLALGCDRGLEIKTNANPAPDTVVNDGDLLFYIANSKISDDCLENIAAGIK